MLIVADLVIPTSRLTKLALPHDNRDVEVPAYE